VSEQSTPWTILLVEDDQTIAEPLIYGLEGEGCRVLHLTLGRPAAQLVRREQPDVVLLDVMLPDVDGFRVCRTLRDESAVPIIMLTARGQELERVMGLELGADDYVVKPFSFRELYARIRSLLRRRSLDQGPLSAAPDRLSAGSLTLDRGARRVWRGSDEVQLTAREFSLLQALMERRGQAVRRTQLLALVWGDDWVGDPRTLDVHIRWLREKIEPNPTTPRYIQTVRGFGYRFAAPEAEHESA
jgi:DNA-binding response OmpR family regulator